MDKEIGTFSMSIRSRLKGKLEDWVFSEAYGPSLYSDVDIFMGEMDDIKDRWDLPWCIGGDFNLVRFLME